MWQYILIIYIYLDIYIYIYIYTHSCAHKFTYPLQNVQNVNNWNKIRGIMKIACYFYLACYFILFPVKTWRNLFMPLSPAGWIIVMVSSPAFQRRPLDSCSSSRTLLPGFWQEPENLSISHQTSGPYTGFQLHLGLILKYFYSFINHSMA